MDKRFCLLPYVLVASSSLFGAATGSGRSVSGNTTTGAPRYVVIFEPDDLDPETLSQAVDAGLMPNLQKYVITPGINFSQYFISNSRGCPARESYFNGLYFHNLVAPTSNHQCGIYQFNEASTIAVWSHAAGVRSALFGKYIDGYGYEDRNGDGVVNALDSTLVPPGWDQWCSVPFYSPVYNNNIPPPGVILPQDGDSQYNWFSTCNGGPIRFHGTTPQDYATDVLNGLVVSYVQNLPADGKSLMMWVAYGAPHVGKYTPNPQPGYELEFAWSIWPPQRYLNEPLIPVPESAPNFNPLNLTGKPQWVASKALLNATDLANLDVQFNDRLQALRAVDDSIGAICRALAQKKMLNNTVFMFMSDNGWMYGLFRLGGKLAAYDASSQTPLFVSVGPGVFPTQAGATSNALLANVDIAPTIMELLSVPQQTVLDGTSFVPLLSNPNQDWRHQFIMEHWLANVGHPIFDIPDYKATRTAITNPALPNMLYVGYPTTGESEWYLYNSDPYALSNMAIDTPPGLLSMLMQLQSLTGQLATCGGTGASSCHTLEWQ